MNKLIRHIVGDAQGWQKIFKAQRIRHRVAVALMHGVANQLLTSVEAVLDAGPVPALPMTRGSPAMPAPRLESRKRPPVSRLDEEPEEVFVGPIRKRR